MSHLALVQGDAAALPLADKSVHCCVTSPPYFNLRAYDSLPSRLWPGGAYAPVPGAPPVAVEAWRGVLGGEDMPAAYIFHLLLVLREVRRVLRDDGVVWVNLGDSYSSGDRQGHGTRVGYKQQTNHGMNGTNDPPRVPQPPGYSQGCLLGIPQQLMLAAAADGWVVRQDCIWAKVAPMPESVRGIRWEHARCACVSHARGGEPWRNGSMPHKTQSDHDPANMKAFAPAAVDPACPTCGGTGRRAERVLRRGSWRHTRAHEVVLMLTKGLGYYCDGEAVKEPSTNGERFHGAYASGNPTQDRNGRGDMENHTSTRNPRSVLRPAPSSFAGAHFATFPPALIQPLIAASVPAQCCAVCGCGFAPIVTTVPPLDYGRGQSAWSKGSAVGCPQRDGLGPTGNGLGVQPSTLHGYAPTCACAPAAPPVPGICLDPFSGAGTTLLVSRALGRRAIGVEASPAYVQLSRQRLGLVDVQAWLEGAPPREAVDCTDLPLFRTAEEPHDAAAS